MTGFNHTPPRMIDIFAPAKLNLYLHITRRMFNGYHALDTLMCFADIGDTITIEQADHFSFHIDGDFASFLPHANKVQYLDSDNLVVRAAKTLSEIVQQPLRYKITLTKNLPVAAGIGGGSADAAAVIWGLTRLWSIAPNAPYLMPMMAKLGADIPACFLSDAVIARGIGDEFNPAPAMPDIPVVIINPLKPCSTASVFTKHNAPICKDITLPTHLNTPHDVAAALMKTQNILTHAAVQTVPVIENCLNALASHPDCLLSRMSGSGATCFGIFDTEEIARDVAQALRSDNPDWWIMPATLNRVGRY